ncbi:MAG: hypothetical protein ACLFO5_01865 [Opitutales bacterium]
MKLWGPDPRGGFPSLGSAGFRFAQWVGWWSGGVVKWWSGEVVEWWSGGVVEWWSGGGPTCGGALAWLGGISLRSMDGVA